MTPTNFPESNATFGPPEDLEESQCMQIRAYVGEAKSGSVDVMPFVVVAWMPSLTDLSRLASGQPVYLTMMGGLAPHFLTTTFEEAIRPA